MNPSIPLNQSHGFQLSSRDLSFKANSNNKKKTARLTGRSHVLIPGHKYVLFLLLLTSVQARICVCLFMLHTQPLSRVQLFATPRTIAHQAPLSLEFSRQAYWSGLPFPTPGDFPDPGIEPMSFVSPALAGRFFTTAPPGKLI